MIWGMGVRVENFEGEWGLMRRMLVGKGWSVDVFLEALFGASL